MRKKLLCTFDRIVKWLDTKKISIAAIAAFIFSMLPIWYLAFYARPSGDDYGYSANSRMAWVNTHSFLEVFKAGLETTKRMERGLVFGIHVYVDAGGLCALQFLDRTAVHDSDSDFINTLFCA